MNLSVPPAQNHRMGRDRNRKPEPFQKQRVRCQGRAGAEAPSSPAWTLAGGRPEPGLCLPPPLACKGKAFSFLRAGARVWLLRAGQRAPPRNP